MNWLKYVACAGLAVAVLGEPVKANDQLLVMEKDSSQWVSPTGNYANHRYSNLSQINRDNVGNLR
ncbi:MAG: PQQ-dependent dehydrogenase, methanol/ethanol family, partial [Hyphomicrobiaceae bacterium]